MAWIDLEGDTFRYEISGTGAEWVVLVHEMGGSIESWDPLIGEFNKRYRVLRYDMRGAGLSIKLREPCRFDGHSKDLSTLLAALDITGPVHLVSYAVGAGVCLQFAKEHPALVHRMVLMSPAINCAPAGADRMREWAERIESEGLHAIAEDLFAIVYPLEFRAENPDQYLKFRGRWLANDPTSLAQFFRMLAEGDLMSILPYVKAEALLVTGRKDALRPEAYVRGISQSLQKGRHALLDAAHHAPDQVPEQTWRLIDTFLAEGRTASTET